MFKGIFTSSAILLLTVFLGLYNFNHLWGQSPISYRFILEAHKSLDHHQRYQTTQDTVYKTVLTFHPISISTKTTSLYLSSLFTNDDGEITIETGRVVQIPTSLLPKQPLQLLAVPLVVYMNEAAPYKTDEEFYKIFTEQELNNWAESGYEVEKPMRFAKSIQYR